MRKSVRSKSTAESIDGEFDISAVADIEGGAAFGTMDAREDRRDRTR